MAAQGSGDGFEVAICFTGFWLYVFNRRFRENWLAEFRGGNGIKRFFRVLEAGLSILIGLILPHFLLEWGFSSLDLFPS